MRLKMHLVKLLVLPCRLVPDIFEEGTFERRKIGKTYTDEGRRSKKKIPRKQLQVLIEEAQEGDIILTSTLSNFSTDFSGIWRTVDLLYVKKADVVASTEGFDTRSDRGKAFVSLIPLFYDITSSCYDAKYQNQKTGIENARKEGKRTGRRALTREDIDRFGDYYMMYINGHLNKGGFCEVAGISRPTLEKLLKEQEESDQ